MTFYESTEANNASLAINYIIARHGNNTKLAKEIMAKLKKSLKDKSYSFLKKFGDPDAHGKYNEVIKKWNDYTKELTKKEESRNTMQRYKSKFKESGESTDWDSLEEALSYPTDKRIFSVAVFYSGGLGRLDDRHMIALLATKGNARMITYEGKSISFKDNNNNYIEIRKDNFIGWSLNESNDNSSFVVYSKGYATIVVLK